MLYETRSVALRQNGTESVAVQTRYAEEQREEEGHGGLKGPESVASHRASTSISHAWR